MQAVELAAVVARTAHSAHNRAVLASAFKSFDC